MADLINSPDHYKAGGLESIDIIEAYRLGFSLGNAVKYLLRAGRKSDDVTQDLEKARWYVRRAGRQGYEAQFGIAHLDAPSAEWVVAAYGLTDHRAEAMICLLQRGRRIERADILKAEHYVSAAIRQSHGEIHAK